MDVNQFDALSRFVAAAGTRRGILHFLSALPLGALLAVVDDEQAAATRQRKPQRRRANKHERVHEEKKKRKKKKKNKRVSPPPGPGCTPESAARTCAGRCGLVPNNCESIVDCGACSCPLVCPVCQTCNSATGRCEANLAFTGQICGAPGQRCQATGACTCDDDSCPAGQVCNGLACCTPNSDATTCAGRCGSVPNNCRQIIDCTLLCPGCCAVDGSCQPGNGNDACGAPGETCDVCVSPEICFAADCCTPVNPICQATSCNLTNNCGQPINCCAAAGATNPGCEGGACCEQTVSPGSFCSATVPCCQGGQPGSRSCNGGSCCVNPGFAAAQKNQCCSGDWTTPPGFICA